MKKEQVLEFINNISEGDVVIHLSHIDLDGWGSTYMVEKHLKNINVVRLNTDHGDIIDTLEKIDLKSNFKLIITDLNLTLGECELVNNTFDNWIVIDHHGSGKDSADKYQDNYYLDTQLCATQLTFNFFQESNFETAPHLYEYARLVNVYNMWKKDNYYLDTQLCATQLTFNFFQESNFETAPHINEYARLVNVYDMWKKDDELFKKGMLMSYYIFNNPFEFQPLKLKFNSWLFDNILQFLLENTIEETEIQYQRMYMFWLNIIVDDEYLDYPANIKVALSHKNEIKNHIIKSSDKYIIFVDVSTKITQYVFDALQEKEYQDKVLINLNMKNGKCSFRSVNDQASVLAKLAGGGGGHPNAGGCKIIADDVLEELIKRIS